MTSAGLSELKRLINEAAIRKTVLTKTVAENTEAVQVRERRLTLAQRFIIRIFTQKSIPRLKAELSQSRNALEDTQAELAGCYVHIDFGLDEASTGTFAALCRSFSTLSGSQKIWDITESAKTDRVKERTTATNRISRSLVAFDSTAVDIIQSDYKSLRLRNASSFEIHLFPGFILTKETGSDFALLEWKELSADYSPSRFIETDPVPSDSEIVGHTWAKANKDGSPDRRFSDNYQIPIARYGELWLKSPTGLYEAYMISNSGSAEDFAAAIRNHAATLARISRLPTEAEPEPTHEEPPPVPEPELAEAPEPPGRYILDWFALAVIILGLTAAGFWVWKNSPQMLAAMIPAKAAATEPAPLAPPAPSPPLFVVMPPSINVRATPSTKGRIVEKLSTGTRISVFEVRGQWSEIGYSAPTGWTLSKFLRSDAPAKVQDIDAR